MSLFTPELFN